VIPFFVPNRGIRGGAYGNLSARAASDGEPDTLGRICGGHEGGDWKPGVTLLSLGSGKEDDLFRSPTEEPDCLFKASSDTLPKLKRKEIRKET